MTAAVDIRPDTSPRGFRRKARAYVALTKPRVMELLLVTTAPTMFLAQGGVPNLWLVAATLIGGALSAGSASAFNCYIDRDIDRLMKRTSTRPRRREDPDRPRSGPRAAPGACGWPRLPSPAQKREGIRPSPIHSVYKWCLKRKESKKLSINTISPMHSFYNKLRK